MTIALVQSKAAHATASPVTTTFDAAPTAGNLLVAFWGTNGTGTTFAVPSGWTLLHQYKGSTTLAAIWFKLAGVGESSSLSVTPPAGSQFDLQLAEFSGIPAAYVDKVAKGDAVTTTVTSLTGDATAALAGTGDLVLSCISLNALVTSPSWTMPSNAIPGGAGPRLLSAWGVDGDQSPKTFQASWTTGARACGVLGTLSPVVLPTSFEGWGIPA